MTLISKVLYGNKAEISVDNNSNVIIIYKGKIIRRLNPNVILNIKNDTWAQIALLTLEVQSNVRRKQTSEKLNKLAKQYF